MNLYRKQKKTLSLIFPSTRWNKCIGSIYRSSFFPKEIHSKPNHPQKRCLFFFVFCFVFLSNFNPHSPKSTHSSLETTTLPINWGLSFNMKWYTIWLLYIYPLFLTNYSIGPCFLMPNSSNCLVKIYIPDPPPQHSICRGVHNISPLPHSHPYRSAHQVIEMSWGFFLGGGRGSLRILCNMLNIENKITLI